jgi:hypothetical protein
LCSFVDAATELGIALNTLRDVIVQTGTPIIRFGHRLFIERCELDRLIDSHRERLD